MGKRLVVPLGKEGVVHSYDEITGEFLCGCHIVDELTDNIKVNNLQITCKNCLKKERR